MRIICLLSFLLTPTLSSAASFDCAKASTAVEKLICGSPQISRQDEELSVAYKEAATQARDKDPLVIDQKRWLKNERSLCRDENCLKKVYQERIAELRKWNEPAFEDKDIFGNYLIQRDNFLYSPDKGYQRARQDRRLPDSQTIQREQHSFLLQSRRRQWAHLQHGRRSDFHRFGLSVRS